MIHISTRALEAVATGRDRIYDYGVRPVHYEADDFTLAEVITAGEIFSLLNGRYHDDPLLNGTHAPSLPTCPVCAVALDKALEERGHGEV